MIIQCGTCQTRFRLADEKVKDSGTKVRCSRCGEIFTVMPPAPAEPVRPPVEPPDLEPAGGSEEPFATPGDQPVTREEEAGFDDWTNFGEEGADSGQEGPSADEELDFDLGDAPEETVPETDFALGGPATDELEFESDSTTEEDFGGLAFEDELGAGVADEFAFDDDSGEDFSDLDGDQFSWDDQAGTASEDEFDLGLNPTPAPGGDPGPDAIPVQGASAEAAAIPVEQPPAAPAPLPVRPPRPATKPAPVRRRSTPQPRKSSNRGMLWFCFLLLLGVAGGASYLYWKGALPDTNQLLDQLLNRISGQPPQAPPASRIQVSGLASKFVTNQEAGQLFVISGQAVNGYDEPRSALAVKGVLFSRAGAVLRERAVYCGNPLSEGELKTLPLRKIRDRGDNQFGDSLANLNVAPGKSIPFTIVFSDLPPDLAEFIVEPAESIPGNRN